MVQPKKTVANSTNGQNKRDHSNMSFQKKDISEARAMSAKADTKANGSATGFRTDTAISSARPGGERTLQRWVSDAPTSDMDLSLENTTKKPWNQFEENERRFGLKSDYDENIYTTAIDKSHPQYQARLAAADKKAREIERSVAATSHVAEERIMDHVGGDDHGADEEDKYSGVKRGQSTQDFPPLPGRENKYTPPARRAPTGAATVKGAPVDPAIISSQLKSQKAQTATKGEDSKARLIPTVETSAPPSATKTSELKQETKPEIQQKATETKPLNQTPTPLRPSAATSRTISPQAKEGAAPSATSTVERDVLKEFKTFASQQRMTVEKVRSNKAKADKEVKLIELKKFADSFKLPTPVPMDLISIIAKDPAKQKEIQAKAQRDAAELARRKEEAAAKEKKPAAATSKEGQAVPAPQPAPAERPRPTGNNANNQPAGVVARHPGNRQSFVPPGYSYRNDRPGPPHMGQSGRQTGNLAARIRNVENQRANQDLRQPPTGPANAPDAPYPRRMGGIPSHMSAKLNPNSHEFRPSPFAATFSPNGHPSAGSSPRSAANNAAEAQAGANVPLIVVVKKRKGIDKKKCAILSFVKTLEVPPGKNWDDNEGIKPSFDTPPTWRQPTADEETDVATMKLSVTEFFERQPFSTQPTPHVAHSMPQMAHQHQLPFHLQQGAHHAAPRQSPHVPPVQMHPAHGPVPHVPYNGTDDHRMMHSNSAQSFSSPRMNQVPMAAYPPNMNAPVQVPYGQGVMQPFMPGTPQMGHFNRSFSNNPQYMPQQQVPMGGPMMIQPQYITPQGMPGPQMQMYPSGQHFMPPGAAAPQPMPGANGYPSPGRPAAPMMVHQGSQQGQPIYGMSPGMQYQQPVYQQPAQMNNMRGYNNPGPQQFGTSPQQMHQYGPQQHRNNNNFKNYQGHNQHQGPQSGHPIPSGPQGRTPDAPDEAK